jgi:signal-transduction protein with cAMP-binding, CBS, and nucleotidyltransferase domain
MKPITAETSGGMRKMALAQVMDLPPRPWASVDIADPMWKVVEVMKSKNRGAVVVEEDGAIVGIFTERDLVSRLDHTDVLWSHVLVKDVMTAHPTVVRPYESVAEAMRLLTQGRRRHLPVVDDKGKVQGMLSIRDILTYVAGTFPEEMMNLPPTPEHES